MKQQDKQSLPSPAHAPYPGQKKPRRRRRVWRLLKWFFLCLLVLMVVMAGVIAWVAGTRSGTEFAWQQIERFLPEGIHIDKLEGRLIGPLHISGLHYETEDMKARVGRIDFDMKLADIWQRTVHIKHLDVSDVDYEVTHVADKDRPEPEDKADFNLPEQIKLPLAVVIDRISVANVKAITAPDAKPIEVDSLKLLEAHLDETDWQIKSLTGKGPLFDVDAKAQVTPNHGYSTNLHVKANAKLPDYAPVKAQADITGSLDDLNLALDVDAPYNVKLRAQLTDALKPDKMALDALLDIDEIKTQEIAETLPAMTSSAHIRAKGGMNDLDVQLDAAADSQDYGKANVKGGINYTPQAINIKDLRLAIPATNGQLTANGQVALAEGNKMDLAVDWKNLAWPLSNKPDYTSEKGRVTLSGTMEDYQLKTDLDWRMVGQTRGSLAARGTGDLESFNLEALTINGDLGRITGHAKTRWAPELDVDAHLEGKGINPGAVLPDMPGNFDLALDVGARQKGDQIHADLRRLNAKGQFRHQPLNLSAKAQYLGDHVHVDRMHLDSGPAVAEIAGTFGWLPNSRLDGHWSIHSSDLSRLMPGLGGELQTEGRVSGLFKAPNIQAQLKARNLLAYGNRIRSADMNALVDWSGQKQSHVDLAVNDVNAAGQDIDQVQLKLNGTPDSHHLTLDLDSQIARANLAMKGALNKNTYEERYTLEKLDAAYDKLPAWHLASPATGKVSAQSQSIEDACLNSNGAKVCISGSHDARASKAHIKLSDFNYDYAKEFFPEGLDITGAVSGTVDANLPTAGTPRADIDLRTTAGQVTMTNPEGERVKVLDMQPGRIALQMARNGLDASVDLPLAGDNDGIQAKARVAEGSGDIMSHALSGHLHIGMQSLGFITRMSTEVDELEGEFAGDMELGGTLARPEIRGKMGLQAPRIVLVTPGITLKDVNFSAEGLGKTIALKAGAESGGGQLNVDGNINLARDAQTIDLAIKGDRFQMANIPDARAYISPDLKVAVTTSSVDVDGSVTIPEASITPKNLPEAGATTSSSDLVIVTEEETTAQKAARAVHADIKVILGDDVKLDAFGLKTGLAGSLRVVQDGDNVPTGSGAIELTKGSFRAYGQNLDIQTGRILFSGGPVSEPGLDIRAARYPSRDVTVGVHVRGSPRHPSLDLFSEPGMSQSEQLSWLLLGKPLDDTSGEQSSMVTKAAMALGTAKGNQMLQSLGDKLGIDDIGLGSGGQAGEDREGTSLRVGKYLSPNLYVGYGLGLFDQLSTMFMRYTLNSNWSIETNSSSKATGGDLIWRFER